MATTPQELIICLLVYLGLMAIVVYITLFGDHPCHRNTPLPRIHNCLTTAVPVFLHTTVLAAILGPTRAANVRANFASLCELQIIPLFYLLLLHAGMYITHNLLAARVPLHPALLPAYYFVCLISWILVLVVDPGTVTSHNASAQARLYPPDNIIFATPLSSCRTCATWKPPRSKHCPLCKRCVSRFDHHCGWVGTCVGLYNTRHFLFFLAIHTFMHAHGVVVTASLIMRTIRRLIDGGYVYSPTNQPVKRFTLQIAVAAETTVCALFVVFLATFLLLAVFLGYHLSLAARNLTTNESVKWQAVRQVARDYQTQHNRSIGFAMTEEAHQDARDGNPQSLRNLPAFDARGFPVNAYHRGIFANFSEVFFPHAFARSRNIDVSPTPSTPPTLSSSSSPSPSSPPLPTTSKNAPSLPQQSDHQNHLSTTTRATTTATTYEAPVSASTKKND